MTDAPLSSVTGKPMVRDTRPLVVSYKGNSITVQMPGWYCIDSDESIHVGDDMNVFDAVLRTLKIKADNLLSADDVRTC